MPVNNATTNLSERDFSGRNMRGWNLVQHRLMRSNFTGADLTGANLEEADCSGAIFTDALLDKVNFTGAVVTEEQIKAAKSSKDVILPASLIPPPPPPDPDAKLVAENERLKAQLEALLAAKAESEPEQPAKGKRQVSDKF